MEFPINTQEEFDAAVKDRLKRAEKSFEKRYSEQHAEEFEKAKAYDELQERQKSELQKAEDRAAAAEAEAEKLRGAAAARDWADEVSKETGVPAALIHGATKEEMQSNAEQLKSYAEGLVPAAPHVGSEGRRPSDPSATTNAERFAALVNDNL